MVCLGRTLPFYGTQFHPEKAAFEWTPISCTPHGPEAILLAQYLSNFFVSEARKSENHFQSYKEELNWTIYKEIVIDTTKIALKSNSRFMQTYIFDDGNI